MSHVSTIDIHIKDLDALEAACKRIGLELVRGKTRYEWFGRHVGDYPLPEGFTKEELGTCEHAIRIPDGSPYKRSNSYEIGVCQRRDGQPGYVLQWDFWMGGHGLQKVAGADCNTLRQSYSTEVTKRNLLRAGCNVQETTLEDGTVQLRAIASR